MTVRFFEFICLRGKTMPRANRFQLPGMICHLTHRCHDRSFLFKFARDRTAYCDALRLASKEFRVSLLNFSVTSNHTHELAIEAEEGGISRMMQKLEGSFGGAYNRRKHHSGAFWEDRYHCTMVEDGGHLWNCIPYIDLNMVRAGVVSHPAEWQWCGYRELVGQKERYRLLDMERLLELLGIPDIRSLQIQYAERIRLAIEQKKLHREKRWTESIAVGSRSYVAKIEESLRYRRRRYIIDEDEDGSCAIWESCALYSNSRTGLFDLPPP
jgi:putative transposase